MVQAYEYDFWHRHPALPLMLVGIVFAGALTTWLAIETQERAGFRIAILFLGFSAPAVILNAVVEWLNRDRFGTIQLSDDRIGTEQRDGSQLWIPFSEVERVEAVRPGSPDYTAARWQGGVRIVSAGRVILIYETIQEYSTLKSKLKAALESRSIPVAWR